MEGGSRAEGKLSTRQDLQSLTGIHETFLFSCKQDLQPCLGTTDGDAGVMVILCFFFLF